MIIKPRIRGFICTTAHPVGCAHCVQEQIYWVEKQPPLEGFRNVLVVGASTGYGLAARIAACFGGGARTVGVFFERPALRNRTASAGWYNSVAFERAARNAGHYSKSINGDAFSDEIKEQTISVIREDLRDVDLVVYSLASPRRTHPRTGAQHTSALKTVGEPYTGKTVDIHTGVVSEVTIEPATDDEIDNTVAVMGGEDWDLWIQALEAADVLARGVRTVAFTYIGPELTRPVYGDGTIGKAKIHLEATARELDARLRKRNGRAYISANKAVVTQSSAAVPVVSLYISLLYNVMKEKNIHEGCIEQMYRLLKDRIYARPSVPTDESGRIRIDDLELRADVQSLIESLWQTVTTENLEAISDVQVFRAEFLKLFGFGLPSVDYAADVDPDQPL
ncbi:MAG: trans-2-enoyl-CoA reductase family protein [Gemmatimonadota bacterium]|nr:trans-2-enoyl-CoA reductase family protein [Gemmatimonadota bacterium]